MLPANGPGTKLNLLYACFDALKKLSEIKVQKSAADALGVVEGSISA